MNLSCTFGWTIVRSRFCVKNDVATREQQYYEHDFFKISWHHQTLLRRSSHWNNTYWSSTWFKNHSWFKKTKLCLGEYQKMYGSYVFCNSLKRDQRIFKDLWRVSRVLLCEAWSSNVIINNFALLIARYVNVEPKSQ